MYVSDKPVTLRQGQHQQTWKDSVKPEQGYNHAKFERFHFHVVREKANCFLFFSICKNVNYLQHMPKEKKNTWYIHDLLVCFTILKSFNSTLLTCMIWLTHVLCSPSLHVVLPNITFLLFLNKFSWLVFEISGYLLYINVNRISKN